MNIRLKSELVTNNGFGDAGTMTVLLILLAPGVMWFVTEVERRLGTAAAGWVAALPVAFSMAILSTDLSAGPKATGALALSAASHVMALVVFGVAVYAALGRFPLRCAWPLAVLVYIAGAFAISTLSDPLALAGSAIALIVAPRLTPPHPVRKTVPRGAMVRGAVCASAALIVAAGVIVRPLLGVGVAGACLTFPTTSTILMVVAAGYDGRQQAANVTAGMVRSLPCYFGFSVTVAALAPVIGALAIIPGFVVCGLVASASWTFGRVGVQAAPAA